MKLLIACGDTTDVQIIVADLQRAGLPPSGDAIVLSVADLLPMPAAPEKARLPAAAQRALERAVRALENARRTAAAAAAQVGAAMPGWRVSPEAVANAPAWAIVTKADAWRPDLIVVASHDASALARLLLGSVSQAVLAHATTSVRIVRARPVRPQTPPRLLVGVDGSPGADAAVARVASRSWQPGCQVCLIMALDPSLVGVPGDDLADDRAEADHILNRAAESVRAAGLAVSTAVVEGPAKRVLVEYGETWRAECVFVGARGLRGVERLLLGSVSASVAARAHCSVEVVRP